MKSTAKPPRDKSGLLLPTGECWCGCGRTPTLRGKFFLPGHDRVVLFEVLAAEYGDTAEFLVRHGYGPGSRKLDGLKEKRS